VIAAAPLSGYLSIQSYVPYSLWSQADAAKYAIQQSSLANYRHELLAAMTHGVPIYQQHGSDDDNVPPYHSRMMHQLIAQTGWKTTYSELDGKTHWWEDVMTTPGLAEFFQKHLNDPKLPSVEDVDSFEIVVATPSSTGFKYGIRILYLQDPGRLGRLRVKLNRETDTWRFEPENIMVFEIQEASKVKAIEIEDMYREDIQTFNQQAESQASTIFRRDETGSWILVRQVILGCGKKLTMHQSDFPCEGKSDLSHSIRSPLQFGGLEAILRMTTGKPFHIRYSNKKLRKLAVQISRNLYQYYGADTAVVHETEEGENTGGYLISIAVGVDDKSHRADNAKQSSFPIQISPETGRLRIRDAHGRWARPGGSSVKLGAIYLRPSLEDEQELVIWGESLAMIEQAARLVPMITGTGQPDFVIVREDAAWRGVDGTYLGFFDAWWNVTESSVLG
jgi:hypothetical protein